MSEQKTGMVSVIVPTRNSDKFLDLCLHCIVNQTYQNIEVILCDGASEDRTVRIIENYIKEYPYIRCLALEDRGVSFSRNAGIEVAEGEYIIFVDSDDFLQPTACEVLVKEAQRTGAELVMAGYRRMMTRENTEPSAGVFDGAEEFASHMKEYCDFRDNCIKPVWNKLYRKEGLRARFSEKMDLREDILFNLAVLERAERIAVISDTVYEYNNEKAMQNYYRYREDGFVIETLVHEKLMDFMEKYGQEDKSFVYSNYMKMLVIQIIALIHKSGWSENECKKRLQEWMEHPVILDMVEHYEPTDRKEKKLLKMLARQKKSAVYRYYKTFERGKL